jgi:hypothetical protein
MYIIYVDVKMLSYYVLVCDANLKSFDGLAYKGMSFLHGFVLPAILHPNCQLVSCPSL